MTQTRINYPRTPEELEALLDMANGVIYELHRQRDADHAEKQRLTAEIVGLRAEIKQLKLESVGAGGVPRIMGDTYG